MPLNQVVSYCAAVEERTHSSRVPRRLCAPGTPLLRRRSLLPQLLVQLEFCRNMSPFIRTH